MTTRRGSSSRAVHARDLLFPFLTLSSRQRRLSADEGSAFRFCLRFKCSAAACPPWRAFSAAAFVIGFEVASVAAAFRRADLFEFALHVVVRLSRLPNRSMRIPPSRCGPIFVRYPTVGYILQCGIRRRRAEMPKKTKVNIYDDMRQSLRAALAFERGQAVDLRVTRATLSKT
jgi:hypothetical protein